MSFHAFFNLFRAIVASRNESYADRVLGFRFECTVVPYWRRVFSVFAAAVERDFSIPKDKITEADWMSWYHACLRGSCDYRLEDDSMFSAEAEFTRTWFDASQPPGFRQQMGRDWGFCFGVDEEKVKSLTGLEEPSLAVAEENFWRIHNKFNVCVVEKGISIGDDEMTFRVDLPATLHYLCELKLKVSQGGAKLSELVKLFELGIIKDVDFKGSEIKIPTAQDFVCVCDFGQGYFVLRNEYFELRIFILPTLERYDKWPLG